MEYWKEVLTGLQAHFRFVANMEKAYIVVSDWIEQGAPIPKSSKVKVGGTMFLVSSFFKEDAKGTVVDKVARLIERESENIAED